ncbi:hypothetical protein HYD63_02800 [Mycoplasmopsis bovis]|nr:hypothetical protein [Mycoplasmopsis bovis]QQH60428.1 hypothetical protein HYD63_02800 [Mycoplasmopsis bovis]
MKQSEQQGRKWKTAEKGNKTKKTQDRKEVNRNEMKDKGKEKRKKKRRKYENKREKKKKKE